MTLRRRYSNLDSNCLVFRDEQGFWLFVRRHSSWCDTSVCAGMGSFLPGTVSSPLVDLVRLRCADRDAVSLKPGKERAPYVLRRALEPCSCSSVDCRRETGRAKHR